jgi:hypothetical protein
MLDRGWEQVAEETYSICQRVLKESVERRALAVSAAC